MGALRLVQLREGLVQLVGADVVVEDVEPREDRLVEHAALVVVAATVEVLRVLEQGEAGLDQSRAGLQVVGGVPQPFAEAFAVALDLAELGLDLDLGQVTIRGEVDKAGFLGVQCPEFGGDLLSEEPVGLVVLRDGGGEVGTYVGDESVVEPDRGVVLLDGIFDELDVDVGGVAGAFLPVTAEEVPVFGSAGVDGALDDHPAGLSCPPASSAVQGSLEVVVVDTATLTGGRARVEDILYAVEQVVVDQPRVPSLDLFALVIDVAEVVAVAQHQRELVDGHLLGGLSGRCPGAQPAVVELVG